ncbi:MAG: 23S rRNA (pseudouridine(1915)-N(3))-methyltransferase RlmH [Clostridiales Family XIII bacterium]|jgi:23S rRNA (pseudouridine1915-N3)-methyltransferase|nr:23S rRNA (pseudouridine(1915)-N(3))-methyltransferase RlmH [Clostridiales Family XIII bacterium]
MNYDIICVGSLKERYWKDAETEYLKRLSTFGRTEIHEIKEAYVSQNASKAEIASAMEKEGKSLLKSIPKQAYTIALDGKGQMLSSEGLSKKLQILAVDGVSRVVFFIGGSNGLSKEVLAKSDFRLSFSAFTFPHQMMRTILLEQIYRSCKIMEGSSYHK